MSIWPYILSTVSVISFSVTGCSQPDNVSDVSQLESPAVSMDVSDTDSTSTPVVSDDAGMPDNGGDGFSAEDGMYSINISIGGKEFSAKFYDNESARTIIGEMPFTLDMDDYASQEKVVGLAFDLPSASTETPTTIKAGELYLWSGSSLVLFYTTFSNSYSYVPIGYIVDTVGLVDALGTENVAVSFYVGE